MADVEKTSCCTEAKDDCKDETCCDNGQGACHTGKEECKESCHKTPCDCKGTENCKCDKDKCGC